jgi:hypothetical protein
MASCIHRLSHPDAEPNYCHDKLCLECRRLRAIGERTSLTKLLQDARERQPDHLLFFQTLTLQDCAPAEISSRAKVLVSGLAKLRRGRKLPFTLGWVRVIEVKTSDQDPALENVYLHLLLLFPAGQAEAVDALDWETLWRQAAGELARGTDPKASLVRSPKAVAAYLTKSADKDFVQDALIGIEDPRRYIQRIDTGHNKFRSGGALTFHTSDKLVTTATSASDDGLDGLFPIRSRSAQRARQRRAPFEPIPIEKKPKRRKP